MSDLGRKRPVAFLAANSKKRTLIFDRSSATVEPGTAFNQGWLTLKSERSLISKSDCGHWLGRILSTDAFRYQMRASAASREMRTFARIWCRRFSVTAAAAANAIGTSIKPR